MFDLLDEVEKDLLVFEYNVKVFFGRLYLFFMEIFFFGIIKRCRVKLEYCNKEWLWRGRIVLWWKIKIYIVLLKGKEL